MVSRDALDFFQSLKQITDRTGDDLRPVQAWVVDEVEGRVRLRFGGETADEAGEQRYARNGGAPYAPDTEVMAQPVGRSWFVLGPVQRGAGTSTPSVEGSGALPGAPVFDLLAVVPASVRWQGTVRTMSSKQRALALRMVRQFPGLLQLASGGRVGCRVRLIEQADTWDLDAAIAVGKAEVTAFGTTGSWITDQGAQSLWTTYAGRTYDSRMLFLGTSQMDSTANEITRRDYPYSFLNPEDTWYDGDRAAGRVSDQMVHGFMRQIEEVLRDHGVIPTSVDGYAAAGYGVDPVRSLLPWFQQWWAIADLSGLIDDGRTPDVDARTSLVPFTRVDPDDSWGTLQALPTTGSTEVLPRTTLGIVVPSAINLGTEWGGDQAIPDEQRVRMKGAAANLVARVRRVAGVAVDTVVVNPARFAATVTAATGGINSFGDPVAAEAEFTRVGTGLDRTQARIVLSPYYGPGPAGGTNGFMNFARKQGVAYDNTQFSVGAFGSWGATLTHEWLHSVEQRLRDAGYTVGYGLDCPLVHDGSTSAGQHRAQYPENSVDRDEWRWLDDLMSNKVPKPGGGFYGVSPEMWARIFPPVAVAITTASDTSGTVATSPWNGGDVTADTHFRGGRIVDQFDANGVKRWSLYPFGAFESVDENGFVRASIGNNSLSIYDAAGNQRAFLSGNQLSLLNASGATTSYLPSDGTLTPRFLATPTVGALGSNVPVSLTGHLHTAAAITDFAEAAQDAAVAMLIAGAGVTLAYDDAANTLTITATGATGGAAWNGGDVTAATHYRNSLVDGFDGTNVRRWELTPAGVLNSYDTAGTLRATMGQSFLGLYDAAGVLNVNLAPSGNARFALTPTVGPFGSNIPVSLSNHTHTSAAVTDLVEAVDDRVAELIVAGPGITKTYDDVANTLTLTATGGGTSAGTRDYPITYVSTVTPVTPRTGDFWWNGADNRPTSDDPHSTLIVSAATPVSPTVGNLWVTP